MFLPHDKATRSRFQTELLQRLAVPPMVTGPDAHWCYIQDAIVTSANIARDDSVRAVQRRWISPTSIALLDARRSIPPDARYDHERKALRRQLINSLRNDREQWWVARCREMEKAAAIGNSRNLFRLIRNTGAKRPGVSETIREKDGAWIHSQARRLECWAEHFEAQFNWPSATAELPEVGVQVELEVNTAPSTFREIE